MPQSELFVMLGEVKYANGYAARVMLCEKTGEQYAVVCKDGEPFPDHHEHMLHAMHEARRLAGAFETQDDEGDEESDAKTVVVSESK